jgi:hypothetical protein
MIKLMAFMQIAVTSASVGRRALPGEGQRLGGGGQQFEVLDGG